jgi:(R)-2-hydroxyacyl-CoA dehydratese activating ATPase
MTTSFGIDVGSVAVKAVVLVDGRPARWRVESTRPDITAQCAALCAELCDADTPVCATGYGRNLVPDATVRTSEIMANATAVAWLQRHWTELGAIFESEPRPARLPGVIRTVVDVGGQDSKIITFDADGMVRDFAMNDRCAAGTGRFLEVMARVLELDLARLDALALAAPEPARISSSCTVFAESEVVSLLADGVSAERVAAGVFESVAAQIAGLGARCQWRAPALFDGGPSASRALCQALGRHLGADPVVPPCGQLATAIGAALTAGG